MASIQSIMPKTQIETQTIVLTPELAARYLETTDRQRSVSSRLVARLATEIRAGRWQHTHQGLAFDLDGRLIDGQHRCHAVIAADQAITIQVTRGVPAETFSVMDQGKTRTRGDIFTIAGVTDGAYAAAATRVVSRLIEGPEVYRSELVDRKRVWCAVQSNGSVRQAERDVDLYNRLSRVKRIPSRAEFKSSIVHMKAVWVGVFWYLRLFADDKDCVESFHKKAVHGIGLGEGDPGLLLREYIARNKAGRRSRKHWEGWLVLTLFRGWAAEVLGEDITLFRPLSAWRTPPGVSVPTAESSGEADH